MTYDENEKKQLEAISTNIKYYLDDHEITQAELAKAVGVSESAVGKWVLGHNAPTMGNIQRMADYFKIPKSALLDNPIGDRDRSFASNRHEALLKRMKNYSDDKLALIERLMDAVDAESENYSDT